MGCCFSTRKQDQNGLKNQQPHFRSSNATHEEAEYCRVAPQPPLEEESVKEVLSETPISKPQQVPILTPETKTQMPIVQPRKSPINKASLEEASEEASLVSGTCSISESFSTITTATVPEMREDEATSKPRSARDGTWNRNRPRSDASRKRSHTVDGNGIGGRERRSKSPARLPEIPTEKKVLVSSRSVRRREFDQVRRDPGEGSGRRSRSPSYTRTVSAGAGRSQLKPTGGAGRRLPAAAKGVEKENGWSENVVGERNDGVSMEESLENPHISLECFIFL
ncbi:hypothetical protein SESBI_21730 [Sesbania bispinosa]|nr:hypothetical protein SESBI_21730 [Sesbania bispinosa]